MGSISSRVSAHSFYGVTSAKIIGECGICGDGLVSGRNQVYTMCEHLFCISCLLKWCKRCQDQGHDIPTCPLCRYALYNNDDDLSEAEEEEQSEAEEEEQSEAEEEEQSEAEEEEQSEAEEEEPSEAEEAIEYIHVNNYSISYSIFINRNAVSIRA